MVTSINAKQTKKKTMIQQSDKTTTKTVIYLPLKANTASATNTLYHTTE